MESLPSADMEHFTSYWLHKDQASSLIPHLTDEKNEVGGPSDY